MDKIKTILEDLYKIDPELQQKEKELIKIINKFLVSCPNTKFNSAFAIKLRQELLGEETKYSVWEAFMNFMSMKKIAYVSGGVLIAVLVIVPAIFVLLNNRESVDLSFKQSFDSLEAGAFGKISTIADDSKSIAQEATGYGGGGQPTAPRTLMASSDSAEENVAGRQSSGVSIGMPAPEFLNYTFRYTGENIDISQIDLPVVKRNKSDDIGKKVGSVLGKFNLGLINFSKFSNLKAQQVSLSEDVANGYAIYFNFEEGQISITRNWQRYIALYESEKEINDLSDANVPEDSALISIADKFLSKYGINKSAYGTPQVDSSWQRQLKTAKAEGQKIYVPQYISVIYPLEINGVAAYEEYGSVLGLDVVINIAENEVYSVNNLYTQNYESSTYELDNDFTKIIKVAEAGGLSGLNYYSPDSKQPIEFELETPKIIYIKKYIYLKNTSEEILVPGLLFKVKNNPQAGYVYRDTVVVPIVKEMLGDLGKNTSYKVQPRTLIEPISAPAEDR